MATVGQKMEEATAPARSPSLDWLEQMLGHIFTPQSAPQPALDTSWHDQQVQRANQSFQQQQQAPPRRKPLPRPTNDTF